MSLAYIKIWLIDSPPETEQFKNRSSSVSSIFSVFCSLFLKFFKDSFSHSFLESCSPPKKQKPRHSFRQNPAPLKKSYNFSKVPEETGSVRLKVNIFWILSGVPAWLIFPNLPSGTPIFPAGILRVPQEQTLPLNTPLRTL